MSSVSSGQPALADVEKSLNRSGLGEIIHRNVYFPRSGEDVLLVLDNPYSETEQPPNGNYRVKVVQGNRRANIRRGSGTWTWETVYFVSDTDDVYADIAIEF